MIDQTGVFLGRGPGVFLLTIFIDKKTGEPLRDKEIMDKIILEVEKNGSDIWLSSDASKFLGTDKDPKNYEIIQDILDVWFTLGQLMHLF